MKAGLEVRRPSRESRRAGPVVHSPAFTLIELLVVIGIIALLAALLLPAVLGAIKKANVAKASNEVIALKVAIKAFYNDYNRYPDTATGDTSYGGPGGTANGTVIANLIALSTLNTRGNCYIEISSDRLGGTSGGDGGGNNYFDPWDCQYGITMDLNYDNKCTSIAGGGKGPTANMGVVVWSAGPDGQTSATASPASGDDITSW